MSLPTPGQISMMRSSGATSAALAPVTSQDSRGFSTILPAAHEAPPAHEAPAAYEAPPTYDAYRAGASSSHPTTDPSTMRPPVHGHDPMAPPPSNTSHAFMHHVHSTAPPHTANPLHTGQSPAPSISPLAEGRGISISGTLDLEDAAVPGSSHLGFGSSSGFASSSAVKMPKGAKVPMEFELGAALPGNPPSCVMPFNEVYTPSQTAVQQQVTSEATGVNLMPADLQVQLAMTGYWGTQNRGRSAIIIPEEHSECPDINDFGPLIPGSRSGFEGPPSMTRAKKYMFSDVTDKPVQPHYPYKIKKPDIRDYVPPKPVGIMVGEDDEVATAIAEAGGATSGATCSCLPPQMMIYSSVQAMMISAYNYTALQDTLMKRGLILGVKNYIVWPPRKDLCLCSHIGRYYASRFIDFSNRMRLHPASKELDLKTTIQAQNEAFANKLLGEIFSIQQQNQIWNYARDAGRLRGLDPRPAFEPDAPLLDKPIDCLGASDLPQVFGPGFASNPDTYNAARTLSKPASIFHEDFKKWTGIDYSQHYKYKDNVPMR